MRKQLQGKTFDMKPVKLTYPVMRDLAKLEKLWNGDEADGSQLATSVEARELLTSLLCSQCSTPDALRNLLDEMDFKNERKVEEVYNFFTDCIGTLNDSQSSSKNTRHSR